MKLVARWFQKTKKGTGNLAVRCTFSNLEFISKCINGLRVQHEDFKLGKSAPPSGHVQQLKHLLQNSAFLSYRSQHKQKSWQNTARTVSGCIIQCTCELCTVCLDGNLLCVENKAIGKSKFPLPDQKTLVKYQGKEAFL